MQEITIIINKDGSVELEVDGVVGPKCTDITKAFNDALGQVTEERKLPQYYDGAENENYTQL